MRDSDFSSQESLRVQKSLKNAGVTKWRCARNRKNSNILKNKGKSFRFSFNVVLYLFPTENNDELPANQDKLYSQLQMGRDPFQDRGQADRPTPLEWKAPCITDPCPPDSPAFTTQLLGCGCHSWVMLGGGDGTRAMLMLGKFASNRATSSGRYCSMGYAMFVTWLGKSPVERNFLPLSIQVTFLREFTYS